MGNKNVLNKLIVLQLDLYAHLTKHRQKKSNADKSMVDFIMPMNLLHLGTNDD